MHAASALVLLWQTPGSGVSLPRVCQRRGNRTFSGSGGAQPSAPAYVPRIVAVTAATYTGAGGTTPAGGSYSGATGQRPGAGKGFGG